MASFHYILLSFLILHSFATASGVHRCDGSNFTANGTYQSNLNLLLSSLSSSNLTFSKDSIGGNSSDSVYGLVQCSGYVVDPSYCPVCYQNLFRDLTQLCPYSKQASIWDENCQLRYSDMSFFSSFDIGETPIGLCNVQNRSDPFANMSRLLFVNVSDKAAFDSSTLFATGKLTYSESTIYALAECTRDLSGAVCNQCLLHILDYYWNTCRAEIGALYYSRSGYYHYEVTPFYKRDPTVLLNLLPSPPPSAPVPTPNAPVPPVSPPTSTAEGNGEGNNI